MDSRGLWLWLYGTLVIGTVQLELGAIWVMHPDPQVALTLIAWTVFLLVVGLVVIVNVVGGGE